MEIIMISEHRFFVNFQKYRFLLEQLVKRDIKVRYRNSMLGIFWSFLEPLLTMIVFTIIFSYIFKRDIPNFPVYYLIGRVSYTLFNSGTTSAMMSIIGNANILKSVYVPKYLFALASVLSGFVTFLLSLIILFAVMIATNVTFTIYIIFACLPVIVLLILTLGVGLILATATVFFRDMQHLYGVFSLLLMYGSAIFYPASIIPPHYQWLLTINPFYEIIFCIRTVILNGTLYDPGALLYATLFAIATLIIGMGVFYRYQNRFLLKL
jgi:ABC-type polysaccharide/polyol phosphate export permease